MLGGSIINEIGSGGGGIRDHIVEINSDVVVVDVAELEILNGVKLHGEEMVREVPNVGRIEKAQILTGKSTEVLRLRNGEGEAMATEGRVLGDDGDGKSGGERKSFAVGGVFEANRGTVKGMAL